MKNIKTLSTGSLTIFKITNIRATAVHSSRPFRTKELLNDNNELLQILDNRTDGHYSKNITADNVALSYYRMQLFLYADLNYDSRLVVSPTETELEIISAVSEQPCNYAFDDSAYADPSIKLSDKEVGFALPYEMYVAIPEAANCILEMLSAADRTKCIEQYIHDYLFEYMPINILSNINLNGRQMAKEAQAVRTILLSCPDNGGLDINISAGSLTAHLYDHAPLVVALIDALDDFIAEHI